MTAANQYAPSLPSNATLSNSGTMPPTVHRAPFSGLWVLISLVVLCTASLQRTASASPWVDAFGPSRPLYGLGFGGVVVGVDATGRVDTLLWPHAGANNQLAPPPKDSALPSGCEWGVDGGQDIHWLSQPSWRTEKSGPPTPESASLEILSTSAELKTTVTQTFITSPKNSLLAVRIALNTPTPVRAISWFQQFAPVPEDRLPLALPIALPQAACGFATFYDAQRARLYQFRPAHVGSQDWDHARRLKKECATPAEWSSFSEGAWCATAFSTPEIRCELRTGENRAMTRKSAVGPAAAVVSINPGQAPNPNRAEVFIAFAKSRDEADQSLDNAIQLGFDALQTQTQTEYAALLSPALPLLGDATDTHARALRDLRSLFTALNPDSGTVVAAPAHQPSLCAVSPELAAWTSLAWQLAGYPDRAMRQLQFFRAPLLATEDAAKTPATLPELLHTDGTPALPSFVRNPASAAWTVLAAVQLTRHSSPEKASADAAFYYNDLVLPVMHYLRRWSLPANGGPPPGFDPVLFRDINSVSGELEYYMAVEGALELASLAKRPPEPSWQSWQRELEALLRFRIVNDASGWDLAPTLAAWASMTLAPDNPLRKATLRTSSGIVALGESVIPALPLDNSHLAPDTLDCAVDLVALLHRPARQP